MHSKPPPVSYLSINTPPMFPDQQWINLLKAYIVGNNPAAVQMIKMYMGRTDCCQYLGALLSELSRSNLLECQNTKPFELWDVKYVVGQMLDCATTMLGSLQALQLNATSPRGNFYPFEYPDNGPKIPDVNVFKPNAEAPPQEPTPDEIREHEQSLAIDTLQQEMNSMRNLITGLNDKISDMSRVLTQLSNNRQQ